MIWNILLTLVCQPTQSEAESDEHLNRTLIPVPLKGADQKSRKIGLTYASTPFQDDS